MAQTVSLLGDSIYFLVFMFMAKKASGGSNLTVGLVMAATAVPFLILAPTAGVAADRMDRRKIMAWADFTSAGLTLVLAAVSWYVAFPSAWAIGIFAFALSSVNAFFMPARMAAMPRVLPANLLAQGNGVFMVTQQFMWLLGTALNLAILAVIYELTPEKFLFAAALFNSATFLFSGYWVLRLPNLSPKKDEHSEDAKGGWPEFKAGISVVFKNPVLRVTLPTNLLAQTFISGFFIAYLEANEVWFSGDFRQFAVIEVSFAIPMAIFGYIVGRMTIHRPGFAYSLATGIVGITVLLMAWGQQLWFFILCNVLAGMAIPFAWLPIQTYIQAAFADDVRGRVSSAWVSSQMSVQPIGMLCVGPMIDLLGLSGAILVMGGGMALAGFAGLLFKDCREARMPEAVVS